MKTDLETYTKEELIALVKAQEKQVENVEDASKILKQESDHFQQKNESLEQEITWLKYKMANLLRELYGQKRERFENRDNGQLSLPFETEIEEQEKIEEQATRKITYERKKRRKNHPGRMPLPDHLPVEKVEMSEQTIIEKGEFVPSEYAIWVNTGSVSKFSILKA